MAFFKPNETSLQDKAVGNTKWHELRFEFRDPMLKPNKFNPDKDQLAWGVVNGFIKEIWYISQKSVEETLNVIGPINGTVIRVAKFRTGSGNTDVDWQVEYVKGPREPRHIRESVVTGSTIPLNNITDPISQQVQGGHYEAQKYGGGGQGDEEPWYDEDGGVDISDNVYVDDIRDIPVQEVIVKQPVQRRQDRPWEENSEAGAEAKEYVYPPLDEQKLELIRILAEDQAKMAVVMLEAYKKYMPDDLPGEELHTYVRGGMVGLSYDILSLDRDHRIPRVGLRNYVPLPPEEPAPEPEDVIGWTLERKMDYASSFIGLSKSEFVKEVFEYLTVIHQRVTSVHHAKELLKKKLGYATLPTDEESLKSLIHEFLVYNDGRAEGLDEMTACITVSNECGRHPGLMPPINQDAKEKSDSKPTKQTA